MPDFKKIIKENIGFIIVITIILLFLFNNNVRTFFTNQLFKIGLYSPAAEDKPVSKTISKDILFKNGEGKIISLNSLKGKVVFINFWATWCPPCIAEMPSIQKLYESTAQNDIVVLMVDVDYNYQNAKRFMDKKGYTLPVYTPASAIPEEILDGSIPATVVLNKEGEIAFHHKGMANYGDKDFIEYLQGLKVKD